MIRLDLGGGEKVERGWVNLDREHGQGGWRRTLLDIPWPCADGTVEAIRAVHVLEHVAAGADRIAVMNECHRVLHVAGLMWVTVPRFPTPRAVADPTHLSFWVADSFGYFVEKRANARYGIARWEMVKCWFDVDLHCQLRRPERTEVL